MALKSRGPVSLDVPPSLTSDLALRNCLLSGNVSVKIGDYGLSHTKYKVRDEFRQ